MHRRWGAGSSQLLLLRILCRESFSEHLFSFPLSRFRKKAERGRIYFTNLQGKENTPSMINPKPCGHLCCCVIRGCEEVCGELETLGRRVNLRSLYCPHWLASPGLCSDLCPSAQVEAIEYYTKLEEKLKDDYKREKEKVNEKPLGMAFVTFHNETITAM